MKLKKLFIAASLITAFVGLFAFESPTDGGGGGGGANSTDRNWEQNPPYVDSMWVQQLEMPLSGGRNMIMQIKYLPDNTLPSFINIYRGDSNAIVFRDDGVAPDQLAGDYNYAAYLTENIPAFISQMNTLNANIAADTSITIFHGHDASTIDEPGTFDVDNFSLHNRVVMFPHFPAAFNCDGILKREYSLFITKLAVTEDPARTYNVVTGVGNPFGAWTFGQMIKNMANESVTGESANAFLKSWVKNWLSDISVNGQTVHKRQDARAFLIYPWMIKANPAFVSSSSPSTINQAAQRLFNDTTLWETLWNNTPTDTLLKYAPFKLSAIVNRIDVRGNNAYGLGLNNTGETRFIFSLIAPVSGNFEVNNFFRTQSMLHGGQLIAGTVPKPSQFSAPDGIHDAADWKGMNVILEYGNVQTNMCETQAFGQQWADLSTIDTLGGTAYNTALQAITDQVTKVNAASWRPNGSAIGRIRTNERIFFPSGHSGYINNNATNSDAVESWELADWELRQFEINNITHLLQQVPVTNTPISSANYVGDGSVYARYANNGQSLFLGLIDGISTNVAVDPAINPNALTSDTNNCKSLIDWAFLNQFLILNERHVMPDTFPSTSIPMTAGSALLQMDYVHTWNFYWRANTTNHPYIPGTTSGTYTTSGNFHNDRDIRHRLALNTCQGCHAGETKVLFTQVRPLGYGEAADYVGTIPGYEFDTLLSLDTRFTSNLGTTNVFHGGPTPQVDSNYRKATAMANRIFLRVSPFITGKNYSGPISSPSYQDDNYDFADDVHDNDFSRNYIVNDPINAAINSFALPPRIDTPHFEQHGFNDLIMRKQSLCELINGPCFTPGIRPDGNSIIMQIVLLITHEPHYPGWH